MKKNHYGARVVAWVMSGLLPLVSMANHKINPAKQINASLGEVAQDVFTIVDGPFSYLMVLLGVVVVIIGCVLKFDTMRVLGLAGFILLVALAPGIISAMFAGG